MSFRWLRVAAAMVVVAATPGCVVVHTDRTVLIEPAYSHIRDRQAPSTTSVESSPPLVSAPLTDTTAP